MRHWRLGRSVLGPVILHEAQDRHYWKIGRNVKASLPKVGFARRGMGVWKVPSVLQADPRDWSARKGANIRWGPEAPGVDSGVSWIPIGTLAFPGGTDVTGGF